MKANQRFIEADERALSAVIGVILMVAITVAIAATVYVYVSGLIGDDGLGDVVVCGKITALPEKYTIGILRMDRSIYIIDQYGIGDSDYVLMDYAIRNDCNCSLILEESNTEKNVWFVQGGSVSLLDCGCKQ